MQKLFTLSCSMFLLFCNLSNAQVVLNELYGSPGGGKHEFFELFNTGTQSSPVSVDGFTMVTYFEEGSSKGFYVLDLPSLTINPRGYVVGAAALPFSYQAVSTSTNAHFSWNDPALTTNSGYLQKWVVSSTGDNSDGNKDYDLLPQPSNLNDLFYSRSGGGFNYAVFIFQNGVLVNNFYGGTGGSTSQPAIITAMPTIDLNYVIDGEGKKFDIKFSNLTSAVAEFVGSDAGTDNGFIRAKDGVCNTWTKSSSSVNHTPSTTNGPSVVGSGVVTISGSIVRGTAGATSSVLTYDITDASASSFPVTLQVYTDNGSVPGQLDATDIYLTSIIQTSIADPASTLSFTPLTANILVVAKTAAGCFGQVKYIGSSLNQVLPVKLVNFSSYVTDNKVTLNWTIDENETASLFELERSTNGSVFSLVSSIRSKGLSGQQEYSHIDASALKHVVYYRLKMTDVHMKIEYSKILKVTASDENYESVILVQNPVKNKLCLKIESAEKQTTNVSIRDLSGRAYHSQSIQLNNGSNMISIELPGRLPIGIYVATITHNKNRVVKKFVRS